MTDQDSKPFVGWPPLPVELEEKKEDWEKKYIYLMAEFDNYRKRCRKDISDAQLNGIISIITALLPSIESVEMAFSDLEKIIPDDRKKGLNMVISNFYKVLMDAGLENLNPVGKPFNPMEDEAVAEKVDNELPEGTVVNVVRDGYKFKGILIRPSQVVVSKHSK